MKILLTAIGKRVELIKHLKTKFTVVGADCSELNPARYFVDKFCLIPRVNEDDYIPSLLRICKEEKIDCLIPLLENEFPILDSARDEFKRNGTTLILSDGGILDICKDKKKTSEFFEKYSIPSPISYKEEEYANQNALKFPVIVKPADGMGSANVFCCYDSEDLKHALKKVSNPIVQEKIDGTEYTMDVLSDMSGNVIYAVARERIEVINGEVNKSRVVLDDGIIKLSKDVMEALNKEGSAVGPFTLQCFKKEDGSLCMLEINPRFGGGVPLSFAAGADYAGALSDILEGRKPEVNEIKEITMLRYTESVFV